MATPVPSPIPVFCVGSVFAVHRRHVWQHPVDRYERLLGQTSTHHNPEVGHYLERSWAALFWPFEAECVRQWP